MGTVVLTDAKYRSSIAAARTLGRAGYQVAAVQAGRWDFPDPPVFSSRYVARGHRIAAAPEELRTIADYSFRVNQYLGEYLAEVGIQLIDFKLEFGRLADGTIVLADESSPDTCRFWDVKTGAHLDKDLFRRDLGGEEDAYKEVMKRLLGE